MNYWQLPTASCCSVDPSHCTSSSLQREYLSPITPLLVNSVYPFRLSSRSTTSKKPSLTSSHLRLLPTSVVSKHTHPSQISTMLDHNHCCSPLDWISLRAGGNVRFKLYGTQHSAWIYVFKREGGREKEGREEGWAQEMATSHHLSFFPVFPKSGASKQNQSHWPEPFPSVPPHFKNKLEDFSLHHVIQLRNSI